MQRRSFATTLEISINCKINVRPDTTAPRFRTSMGGGKHFLRHPDGKYLPFYVSTRLLREAVEFKECRFRQETVDTITVQIGGRETLSPEEEEKLKAIVIGVTDPAFKVVVKPVSEIDWSDNPKRLLFA